MTKSFSICILLCVLMFVEGSSQPSTQSAISNYTYHPPSTDKQSWQRLNLWLSSTYIMTVLQVLDPNSTIIIAGKSLGMSRLPIAAGGIDDPELLSQSQWFDQRDPAKGRRLLLQATGKKHLELMILLGAYYVFEWHDRRRYRDSIEILFKEGSR